MSANAKTFTAPFVDGEGVLQLTNSDKVYLLDSSDTGLIFAVCHKGKQKRYYLTSTHGGRPFLHAVKRKHGTAIDAEEWLRRKRRL